jgi:hypothetical protein
MVGNAPYAGEAKFWVGRVVCALLVVPPMQSEKEVV